MEDKASLSDQIISILTASSTNETPLPEILSATNVPKKTLNAELQKLKRKGVIDKNKDTPPIWSLKDPNKLISQGTETRSRLTRSKVHVDKESDGGKPHLKKSVDEKIAESKNKSLLTFQPLKHLDVARHKTWIRRRDKSTNLTMNKELGKRIVAYLQRQGRPAKTVDIAKAVGCKTAKEINPTLYAMKRKDIVVKVTESPPTWSVSTEIPHDFLQDEASDFRPNVFTQSQQNYAIAAPVQYPTDGSILAFQETSLFNSDVSFETDYSDLLTGDDNLNSTGGDPLLTGHQSLVSNDAFNIAASDPLNLSRGLFDEDPQNDIAEDDPQNTNRAFISKDTQNDSSSQEFDNGESDSDKLFEDKGEKPSAFRSFFKLDESLSEESGEGDMNENVSDNDNNVDETNDEIGDSIDQSNDGPNEFSESNIMLELHGEHCEMFKDNERNGMNEMGAAQLDDDVTTEKADMDLSPPVLDKQEMNVSEQFHENRNTKEDAVERNSNETEVVFPNELTEELPIGTEEIAPNELPDQLPLDEDSDGSDDAMDRDIDHKNVNVQESLNGKQVEINTVMEDDELNRMPDVASKGQSQFSSGYSCMKVIKTSAVESQSQFYSGDSSMNVIKTSGMQESSLQASHALNVHMTDDENKNNNSIPCEESLSDDCQQLLNAFNPNMPCAQFVLKNKSKLSPDKLTECLQELKEHNLAEQNGNQWQLTESGKMQYRSMSGTGSSLAEHAMPLPRKRPHSSGPPPSPMALVQKERGIEPETSKESPLSFLRGAPKVDPFKHAVDLVHNRVSSSGDSGSHSNVEHLNSDLFPGARTLTSSSYAPISTSPFNRPTQSTVTSAFASGPAYAPVPLMSLNLDNSRQSQTSRTSISNFSSARQQSETNAFSDRTSGSSLFEQESRPSLNQSSGTSLFQQESRPSLNQSSGTSLFQQESRPSLNQSSGTSLFQQESRPSLNQTSGSSLFQQGTVPSFNQSSSSLIRPSNESVNSLFKPPVSSVSASVRSTSSSLSSTSRLSVTQTSSPMAPPATKPKARSDRVVIPKPPPRPGAVASGPSASSQKPPMSPAEMLARGLKKTDISPPKTMDSSPVSMLSSSHSVQLNTSQRSIAGNQSMFKPPAGPQSLLTGNQAGNQFSRGSFQSSGNQSGMLSSNQTGIGNQSGMLSSNQTGIGSSQTGIGSSQTGIGSSQTGIRSLMSQPQSLLSQGGYKPQTLSQGQFGFSSSGTQSQGLGSIGSGFKPLSQLQTSSSAGQFSSLSSSQRQFGSLSGQQSQTAPAVTAAPQPQTTNQSLSLDTESFAALNKNPVSALMEYAQSRKMEARIELIGRRGASHRPVFEMAAFVGKRQFPSVHCSNKKDAKTEACDIALRQLIAEGQFNQTAQTPKPTVAPSSMTHFDKMAALTHRGFTALVSQIRNESFAGRKVIAGLVMKRSETDTGILVSLGTGNRCITGQQLSLEGNTINDSHAEIITRRGFIRFLYKQLWEYTPQKPSPMFERSPRGKLQIKPNITFHLYISTAPCGDGALFSPRDEAANKAAVDMRVRPPHNPTFSSNVQGLLRTKVEGGEGTIPIEPGFKGLTFDGVQRGERLLTMSCTDKVCRWNVVGLQGALLSHFLEPVYLDSLTLGLLYDHGHLARAVCCRVGKGDTDVDSLLPPGYKLNHPWLGRVTVCDPPREVQKTKALSVNWCFGDNVPEVVDGTLGLNLTSIEKQMFSRCSKRNLYNSFKKLCEKFDRQDLLSAQTYREAKDMATDFKTAKEAMLKKLKENKYGKWVSKPIEEEMFS